MCRRYLSAAATVLTKPTYLRFPIRFVGRQLNQAWWRLRGPPDGIRVMDQDWDTLLILDACRADVFEDVNWLPGTGRSVRVDSGNSQEFLSRQFPDQYPDTVYVTGNPFAQEVPDETFHAVVPLYQSAWDDDLGTVPPAAAVEAIRKAHEQFPEKRIIGHLMQPHIPFLGPEGEAVQEDLVFLWEDDYFGCRTLSRLRLLQAYRENVRRIVEHVEPLWTDPDGRSVITADHGELLGDPLWPIPVRGFDHTTGIYNRPLTTVPWFVKEAGERRTITPGELGVETPAAGDVSDRLRTLGYRS